MVPVRRSNCMRLPYCMSVLTACRKFSSRCCYDTSATRSRMTHRDTVLVGSVDPTRWGYGHHGMGEVAEHINPAPVIQAVVVCAAGALWEGCGQGSEHVSKARAACAVQRIRAVHSLSQGWSLQLHQAVARTIVYVVPAKVVTNQQARSVLVCVPLKSSLHRPCTLTCRANSWLA